MKELSEVIKVINTDSIVLLVALIFSLTTVIRNSKLSNDLIPIVEIVVGFLSGALIYLAYPNDFSNMLIPMIDGLIASLVVDTGNKLIDYYKEMK